MWALLIAALGQPALAARAEACRAPAMPPAMRLEAVTRPLLGRAYVLSPLGEGYGHDPDPLLRWGAFDCTTFVETALALVDCGDEPTHVRLARIRYRGGEVAFERRRHFVGTQWTPDLIASGRLTDVTAELAPVVRETFTFDRVRWSERRVAADLVLPEDALPFGEHAIVFAPVAYVAERAEQLPPGLLINVIKVDWQRAPDRVSHQALTVMRSGRLYVRHASTVSKRVVDETPARFFARLLQPRGWPVAGVQLLRITEP